MNLAERGLNSFGSRQELEKNVKVPSSIKGWEFLD
jgi:hypothetical protein